MSQPAVIKSRDGLELVCYYALPHGGSGPAPGPHPTVLLVHGGPFGRDTFRFNPLQAWLADRGYAVLMVNFRGSTGFGKDFLNASNLAWGGKMHDDLIDAVRWAIQQNIADAQRIAIMGGSYGGYAALVGLTFTPDVFACAVAMHPISRLTSFLDSMPEHWKPRLAIYRTRTGDHTTADGRRFLDSRSPLMLIDQAKRPLLIAAGANDPRCKLAESDQIVSAMRAKNLPVEYHVYADEGHGFTRQTNRLSFFAAAERFLARHLGGACEGP
jgi:dipeptidyl aminopeptidase/acylaminoacyl peptidase